MVDTHKEKKRGHKLFHPFPKRKWRNFNRFFQELAFQIISEPNTVSMCGLCFFFKLVVAVYVQTLISFASYFFLSTPPQVDFNRIALTSEPNNPNGIKK